MQTQSAPKSMKPLTPQQAKFVAGGAKPKARKPGGGGGGQTN